MLIILHSLCNLSIEILSDILYLQQICKISFNSGGGGLGIFFKSPPISCNVWHFLLLGQRLVAIKRGSHCGESMEHLSSQKREWRAASAAPGLMGLGQ